ncbi:hypothetical protein [Flavobacterium sp. HTF]|uniref:hypothetical protein n=1 Tax=Flavobacterium sp. HTF TaxID=2170732 RepID=UPI000D5C6FE9|nr:hypothetical protein [Flavobacterium sp. HTF]PWB21468.1 hypothetical protein DCO46_19850 [Flavobacterium sp. HTF]
MKKIILLLSITICQLLTGQVLTTNRNPVGMEHNILFNAVTRYTVTQEGPAITLPGLFDGSMNAYYMAGVTPTTPTTILIEGLPGYHTQAGAWVGWTTRYLPASRFKIEGYDTYNSANVWRVIADYSAVDYVNPSFSVAIPVAGVYSKLKFTFYNGQNGNVGLSELYFIHPEATSPYSGLLVPAANNWKSVGVDLVATNSGNVGIGINTPKNKLDVNGTIHSREVKVDTQNWSDYVFKKEYDLPTLEEVEKHINEKGYLIDMPSEAEVLKDGINLGEMNVKLLQKIEELTLYMIEINKKVNELQVNNAKLMKENKIFQNNISAPETK